MGIPHATGGAEIEPDECSVSALLEITSLLLLAR
jgi:hypothetical protein